MCVGSTLRAAPLRMMNFIHPPAEASALARRLETVTGLPITIVPAPETQSGPSREEEVRMLFREGQVDLGCL